MLDSTDRRRVGEIAKKLAQDGDHGALDAEVLADLLRTERDYWRLGSEYAALRARITQIGALLDAALDDGPGSTDGREAVREARRLADVS